MAGDYTDPVFVARRGPTVWAVRKISSRVPSPILGLAAARRRLADVIFLDDLFI